MSVRHTLSDRGFKQLEPIETKRHEIVRVYESSAAMEPHIWLRVTVELSPDGYSAVDPGVGHAHLTLDQASELHDQLAYHVEHHYQVEDTAVQPKLYEGPPVADQDVMSVYVVLNGSLGMSAGKAAAQAFHCGRYITWDDMAGRVTHPDDTAAWQRQGNRVVVRIAETAHLFARVIAECRGFSQTDEGLTEVERGAVTAFATIPYRRDSAPKILSHKKVQLY